MTYIVRLLHSRQSQIDGNAPNGLSQIDGRAHNVLSQIVGRVHSVLFKSSGRVIHLSQIDRRVHSVLSQVQGHVLFHWHAIGRGEAPLVRISAVLIGGRAVVVGGRDEGRGRLLTFQQQSLVLCEVSGAAERCLDLVGGIELAVIHEVLASLFAEAHHLEGISKYKTIIEFI